MTRPQVSSTTDEAAAAFLRAVGDLSVYEVAGDDNAPLPAGRAGTKLLVTKAFSHDQDPSLPSAGKSGADITVGCFSDFALSDSFER